MPPAYHSPKMSGRKPSARRVRDLSFLASRQAARNAVSELEFPTASQPEAKQEQLLKSFWTRMQTAQRRFSRKEITNRGRIAAKDALDRAGITDRADRQFVYDTLPRFLAYLRTTGSTPTPLPIITSQVGLHKAGDFMIYFLENMRLLTRLEPKNKSMVLHEATVRRKKQVTGR